MVSDWPLKAGLNFYLLLTKYIHIPDTYLYTTEQQSKHLTKFLLGLAASNSASSAIYHRLVGKFWPPKHSSTTSSLKKTCIWLLMYTSVPETILFSGLFTTTTRTRILVLRHEISLVFGFVLIIFHNILNLPPKSWLESDIWVSIWTSIFWHFVVCFDAMHGTASWMALAWSKTHNNKMLKKKGKIQSEISLLNKLFVDKLYCEKFL